MYISIGHTNYKAFIVKTINKPTILRISKTIKIKIRSIQINFTQKKKLFEFIEIHFKLNLITIKWSDVETKASL